MAISSVQSEFAKERKALAKYIREDALLGDFFEEFLFEEAPARNRSAQAVYLDEVEKCDVYLGLFGAKYGSRDAQGISVEDLYRTHDSVPRNSLIARAMSWTSYVEKSGSGTGVIIDKCTAHGLARPEFDPTSGFFKTIIWRTGRGVAKGIVAGASRGLVAGPSRGTQLWPSQGAQSNFRSHFRDGRYSRVANCHGVWKDSRKWKHEA